MGLWALLCFDHTLGSRVMKVWIGMVESMKECSMLENEMSELVEF